MRKHKTIEKTIRTEKLVAIKCDICGKEITGDFWKLTTHHYDWGMIVLIPTSVLTFVQENA